MNRKPLDRIRTCVAAGINIIPLLSLLGSVYAALLHRAPRIGLLLYFAGYAVLAEMVRCYLNKLFPFLVLHIVPLIPIWLLTRGSWAERLVCMAASLFVLVGSFARKSRQEKNAEPFPLAVGITVLALAYFVSEWAGGYGRFQILLCYAYLILVLLESFLSHFLNYVRMEERTNADIPERKLFAQGSVLAFGYGVFMLGTVILFVREDFAKQLGSLVKNGLFAVVRFLVSLLPKGGEIELEQALPQVQTQVPGMLLEEMETREPSILLQLLEKMLLGAVGLGMALLCLYGVFAAVRHFLGLFGGKAEEEDLVEDLQGEERGEKLARGRQDAGARPFRFPFQFQTPRERIRKSYRKFVGRLSGGEAADNFALSTAREVLYTHAESRQEGERLAQLYEKARYTQEECSVQDAREAAKLSRTLATK